MQLLDKKSLSALLTLLDQSDARRTAKQGLDSLKRACLLACAFAVKVTTNGTSCKSRHPTAIVQMYVLQRCIHQQTCISHTTCTSFDLHTCCQLYTVQCIAAANVVHGQTKLEASNLTLQVDILCSQYALSSNQAIELRSDDAFTEAPSFFGPEYAFSSLLFSVVSFS